MLCPTCGNPLQKLEVTTNNGGKFDIDHCGRCGGTWFDPYEINRISFHEIVRISHLTVLPKKPQPAPTQQNCPRCHIQLQPFHGECVPAATKLLRCSKCHGIYATQKALEGFKKTQEETIKEYKTSSVAFPALSVVFVPALFLLLLFYATFVSVTGLQQAKEERIQAEEMVGQIQIFSISPTTASVTFQTKSMVKSTISYGTSTWELTTKPVSSLLSTKHRIRLTELTPRTTYLYRLTLEDESGRKLTTDWKSFVVEKD